MCQRVLAGRAAATGFHGNVADISGDFRAGLAFEDRRNACRRRSCFRAYQNCQIALVRRIAKGSRCPVQLMLPAAFSYLSELAYEFGVALFPVLSLPNIIAVGNSPGNARSHCRTDPIGRFQEIGQELLGIAVLAARIVGQIDDHMPWGCLDEGANLVVDGLRLRFLAGEAGQIDVIDRLIRIRTNQSLRSDVQGEFPIARVYVNTQGFEQRLSPSDRSVPCFFLELAQAERRQIR